MSAPRRTTRHSRGAVLLAALALVSVFLLPGGAAATPPGSNGRIAFKGYLDAERTTGAVFTVRPDGTHRRQLTFPASGTVDDQPDWSPDGSLVAFRRCVPDTVCALYTVRADGSGLRRLSAPCHATQPDIETKCADESEVAFLPDGRRVVLTRSAGRVRELPGGEGWIKHSDIVVRDLTGRHSHVVLSSAPFSGDNHEMVVSPDGTRIAFVRTNSPLASPAGGQAVFVVNIDGTGLRRLTPYAAHAGDHPDWSPDGRWILYRAPDNGDFLDSQLYLTHPDGTGRRQVTHVGRATQLLSASFSPDGTRVVYARTGRGGRPDIFKARLDGTGAEPVTRTPLWESAPDWGPRAD